MLVTPSQPSDEARCRARLTFVVEADAFGGAETYVAALLRHLPGRFERALLTAGPVPVELREAAAAMGVRPASVERVEGKLELARMVRQVSAVRATRPDLVHVNLPIVTYGRHLLGGLVLARVPTAATLHLVAPLGSAAQRRLLGLVFRRLKRLIAVSEETKKQLCSELGVSESVVRVVPNGVEVRPAVARRESPAVVRIGAVGRLTEQKGFDILIEAVRRLVESGEPVEAAIAGDGPERARLEQQAGGLPVSFVGFVQDIPAFLEGLDLFSLSSRREGLPFALLEAMMSGLACVATNVGDVPEAVGPAGVLVAPEDADGLAGALRMLARAPERRLELGRAAHNRAVEQHSVERMVSETAAAFDEALAG
jgi:glycosyltransferase involved in cell wall biosynthesis